jgi:hypothetical protein
MFEPLIEIVDDENPAYVVELITNPPLTKTVSNSGDEQLGVIDGVMVGVVVCVFVIDGVMVGVTVFVGVIVTVDVTVGVGVGIGGDEGVGVGGISLTTTSYVHCSPVQ